MVNLEVGPENTQIFYLMKWYHSSNIFTSKGRCQWHDGKHILHIYWDIKTNPLNRRPFKAVTGFILYNMVNHICPYLYQYSLSFRPIARFSNFLIFGHRIQLCTFWRFPILPLMLIHQFRYIPTNFLCNYWFIHGLSNFRIYWFTALGYVLNLH